MPANPENNKRSNTLPYILLALVATLAGAWLAMNGQQTATPPELSSATLLTPPKTVQPTGLIDQDGKPFGIEQFRGAYTFIFFGYTHCPDICPATLYQFKSMAKVLQEQHPAIHKKTRFMLVSIDPERDTPQYLKDYVQYYNPEFIGITGQLDDIKQFSRQMGVIFERRENEDDAGNTEDNNYLVDHSSAILLSNPQGQLQAVFSAPHQANTIIKDYQSLYQFLEN